MTDAALHASDDGAIRALLARMCDAWARGDAEAYAACFTENSDYITFQGMHVRGRAENARMHDGLFRGVLKGSRISPEIESIERLAEGVALVHTSDTKRRGSRQTLVIVKSGDDWRIRSFQNTRLQPLGIWMTRRLMR
jgi:uncharacterized protein (TIGR02246 family)